MRKNRINVAFSINATRAMNAKNINLGKLFAAIGRFFQILLVTNPLIFWLWAIVTPAKMANTFQSPFYHEGIGNAIRRADFWLVSHLLPRWSKFAFMEEYGVCRFSVKDQVEYFNYCNDSFINWSITDFSEDAQHEIWKHSFTIKDYAFKMLQQGYTSTEAEMIEVIKAERFWIVEYFNANTTFSWRIMVALYQSNNPEGKLVFFDQIRRNGVAAKSSVAGLVVEEEDRKELLKALREYSQYNITRASRSEDKGTLFRHLVEEERELCPRAQMLLTLAQYKSYHLRGNKLSEDVILHKASPVTNAMDWKAWVDEFKVWEDLNFPEWEILVLSNTELRTYLLKTKGVL